MLVTKMDVVRRLSFMNSAYSKVTGFGFRKDNQDHSLKGVIFTGNWAFATNNHFIARVLVPDRPPEFPVFFDMDESSADAIVHEDVTKDIEEAKQNKRATNQCLFYDYESEQEEELDPSGLSYLENFHKFFFNVREYFFGVSRQDILTAIDDAFGRKVNDKTRHKITVSQNETTVFFKIAHLKKDTSPLATEFELEKISITKFIDGYMETPEPVTFTMNVFYFYEALTALSEYDHVEFSYDDNNQVPVIVKGLCDGHCEDFPDIRFGIAQVKN